MFLYGLGYDYIYMYDKVICFRDYIINVYIFLVIVLFEFLILSFRLIYWYYVD